MVITKLARQLRKKASCAQECLAGGEPCLWLHFLREGDFQKAWEEIVKLNPLPAVTGKVCPHPCEVACKRNLLDEPLAICSLENFLGREALERDWSLPNLNKNKREEKVAIIGSGPAGLSCAYQLALQGYKVTIFEQLPVIGGLLRVGIPEFRLPKNLLTREIEKNILSLGVEVKTNFMVDQAVFEVLQNSGEFDAFFIAIGLQKSKKLGIPNEECFPIFYGLEFLSELNLGRAPKLGKKVVIVGGGNTAIDVARSVKRLGSEAIIFYRRTKPEMPAIESEILKAEKEGIEIRELVAPLRIFSQGRRKFLEYQRMELGELDASGGRKPIPIPGSNFVEELDDLIIAVGEEAEREKIKLSLISRDERVFLGGDILTEAGTVAAAIKSGREKAKEIHQFLRKKEVSEPKEWGNLFLSLKSLDYYTPKGRVEIIESRDYAQKEAERCFGCGFEIEGLAKIDIDQERCKGCGFCVATCPYQLLELGDFFNKQGYHPAISHKPESCRGCQLCVLMCPDVAIEIYKGVG